ncbi:MAG: sulfurtransferase [Pseudorhodobacter sp.]|nr:sulfurtransferase [Rhizobacter sp.]
MQQTNFSTLIQADDLMVAMDGRRDLVVLDVSFDLTDSQAGERSHAEGHVPAAIYVHLERDLSGVKTGRNGRHPLPDRSVFSRTVGQLGIRPGTQVVVLDRQGGMYAARLWWMLRWLGHAEVAVLDGGVAAWRAAGGSISTTAAACNATTAYPERPSLVTSVSADELLQRLGKTPLIDARAAERFRGDVEPLDTQAGHIPGALNRVFKDNLNALGRFKSASQLRLEFAALCGSHAASEVVHQCGSGVTACHNLLAMEVAGLSGSMLYPGSWSEWSSDTSRPVARG